MTQPGKNHLSKDVEIKGSVIFQDELTTDGKIDGDILSSGKLIVGKNGSVDGDIQAEVVSVYGSVNGNISVTERCELRGNAHLHGDLDAPRLVIEEGATFVGRSKVLPAGSPLAALVGEPAKSIAPTSNAGSSPAQETPSEESA